MGKTKIIQKGETAPMEEKAVKVSAPKAGQRALRGIAHIQATYNNTMITISDDKGNTLGWSSAGSLGYSGAKKATPFVAARVADTVVEKVRKVGLQELIVRVCGVGSGRDSAIRALANQGFHLVAIEDVTPIPHNGPRAKKPRRV